MRAYSSHYQRCEGREIHYTDWGDPDAPAVIAWHGLARTGRDMDDLAQRLSQRFRVICPDTLGRGLSQWSPEPDREYCLDFYVRLAVALVDQLGLQRFHWVGTSMGGAIGTLAAAGPLRGRIIRLVLNDNGPSLAPAAIARIRSYAGDPPAFDSMAELEQYFRRVYAPYGWLSEQQWRRLTETSARRLPDGRLTPHYDPAMVRQFINFPDDYERWEAWDSLTLPVLCLRGEDSDLLLPETADAMRSRGPCAVVATIAGCGHAPALNVPEQLDLVERFLLA
ncbi:alpha/beta hydrolase [Paucibacter sp. APW11]|uniref:Alpha/beta hydrolase n=1 Tax=Roseateles aquae TaxID=3077235 RepID=A0ABU3PDF4_9BURK|nr:alpha/beta hydrolase [Paucibacter sp. APW11]MDT9000621.1 alpha/beta hydrolase [Paucibacter sp. APW11]